MRFKTTSLSPTLSRWVGRTLILTGLLGLVLSLAGLIFVTVAGAAAEGALVHKLDSLDQALTATNDALVVAETTLNDTGNTLTTLGATLNHATTMITQTQPIVERLRSLTGEGLPKTIGSTRQALASAQATAEVIDRVLGAASIFGVNYNPKSPLGASIAQVSDSLADLPAELSDVAASLGTAETNLGQIALDSEQVGRRVSGIAQSTVEAKKVLGEYKLVVGNLHQEVSGMRQSAPLWIALVRLGLSLLFIWLALAQLGLLSQGWERLGQRREETSIA